MKKNVLVVDDNDVNLELVVLLLESYSKENKETFKIFTASDGQEAVDVCNATFMDLIFMDLMMPVMGGIEATKIIKTKYPKSMVIAISAYGDEAKQKEMLLNGAEDYITKPLNAQLFKSRLHKYFQLIQNRNHIDNIPQACNLFTSKVYNYNINFTISSDSDLSEFWEAMLIRLDFQRHIDKLSDFIRFIYRIGNIQVEQKIQFAIIIEEDLDNFLFTLDNIHSLGDEDIEQFIQKFYEDAIYIYKNNKITFLLQKSVIEETFSIATTHDSDECIQNIIKSRYTSDNLQELRTYTILDDDELDDFETHLSKLNSLILLMKNSNVDYEDIQEISNCFHSISSILSIVNETYIISNAMKELADSILNNQESFQGNAKELFAFIDAFVNDLVLWKTKIFYEGAPSIDFLNDSIATNASMFNALIQPPSTSDKDIDDIFDF